MFWINGNSLWRIRLNFIKNNLESLITTLDKAEYGWGRGKAKKALIKPLVDKLTFERIQSNTKRTNHSSSNREKRLFENLIYCEECGNQLGVMYRKNHDYWTVNCNRYVRDPKRAGGALLDITIYPVTYAYRLWGIPQKIESRGIVKNGIDISEEIVFTYPDFKVNISASIADFKGFEKMSIKGENGEIKATLYHAMNGVTFKKSMFKKETFKGNGPKMNSYLDEFDTVAKEICEGLKESRMVPLKATSDVMHLLDEIREQIGLNYDNLE